MSATRKSVDNLSMKANKKTYFLSHDGNFSKKCCAKKLKLHRRLFFCARTDIFDMLVQRHTRSKERSLPILLDVILHFAEKDDRSGLDWSATGIQQLALRLSIPLLQGLKVALKGIIKNPPLKSFWIKLKIPFPPCS